MCHLPVTYWDTNRPISPNDQKLAISKLAAEMDQRGTPLSKYGFDFSLKILKFEQQEMRGSVEYIDYVRQYCGEI